MGEGTVDRRRRGTGPTSCSTRRSRDACLDVRRRLRGAQLRSCSASTAHRGCAPNATGWAIRMELGRRTCLVRRSRSSSLWTGAVEPLGPVGKIKGRWKQTACSMADRRHALEADSRRGRSPEGKLLKTPWKNLDARGIATPWLNGTGDRVPSSSDGRGPGKITGSHRRNLERASPTTCWRAIGRTSRAPKSRRWRNTSGRSTRTLRLRRHRAQPKVLRRSGQRSDHRSSPSGTAHRPGRSLLRVPELAMPAGGPRRLPGEACPTPLDPRFPG